MIDFTKFWDKQYLLGPNPLELSRSDNIFFWTAPIFIVAGILAKFLAARNQPASPKNFLFSRFTHLFIVMGLLILLWVGARFENIPWISTHLVVFILFLIWLIWLVYIGKYFVKEFRNRQKTWHEEELKRRYLPKR